MLPINEDIAMNHPLRYCLLALLLLSASASAARYGLFVGLNEYNTSYIPSDNWLNFCVADAGAMRTNLVTHGAGWATSNTTLLVNSAGSRNAIRAALSNYAARAVSGDVVVYFHSSHGGNNDTSQANVFLCSYNANYTEDELAADLLAFPSGVQVVVIVDACHSGGLFYETAAARSLDAKATRRTAARNWDLAARVSARMRDLRAARLAAAPARANRLLSPDEVGWMTACAYDQYSFEDEEIAHGWFTYRLLQGFDYADSSGDGWASFQELFDFAALRIPHLDQTPKDSTPAVLATLAGTAGATPAGDAWDYADNLPDGATGFSPGYEAQTTAVHALRQDLDESDFFAFPVMKNRCYTLRSTHLSGDVDAYLYTCDTNGTPLLVRQAFDVNPPADLNFSLVFKPVESGTAYLRVQPYFNGFSTCAYAVVFANAGSADSMNTLTNGAPVSIAALESKAYELYRLPVPAGQTNLAIRLSGGTGDADLYVARGYLPLSADDYNSQEYGNTESIDVSQPPAGDWFIQVYAYDPSSNLTLRATATPGGATIGASSSTASSASFSLDLTNGARVSIYSATNLLPSGHLNWTLRSNAATVVNGKVNLNLLPGAPGQLISVGKPLDL